MHTYIHFCAGARDRRVAATVPQERRSDAELVAQHRMGRRDAIRQEPPGAGVYATTH
jgi:hypothetical protein